VGIKDRGGNLVLRTAGGLVAPGGTRGKLLILCYHRIFPQSDPLVPDCINSDLFDLHMNVVASLFSPLPLSEAVDRLQQGTLPARAISVTFDDGYADNFEVALPILRKHGIPATIFIASGYLDGGRMWNDTLTESVRRAPGSELDTGDMGLAHLPISSPQERGLTARKILLHLRRLPPEERIRQVEQLAVRIGAELPDDLMLSSGQVRKLHAAGIEIGAHTVTHPILSRLSAESAEQEIRDSRRHLQDLAGAKVTGFAYPNGKPGLDYEKTHIQAVSRAGFDYAVSTARGHASIGVDRFQLPRMSPWDRTHFRLGLRIIREFTTSANQLA